MGYLSIPEYLTVCVIFYVYFLRIFGMHAIGFTPITILISLPELPFVLAIVAITCYEQARGE